MTDSEVHNRKVFRQLKEEIKHDVSIFWFRRDLRLKDNCGLYHALRSGKPLILLFIFDDKILDGLALDDPRLSFIYDSLCQINEEVSAYKSSLVILKGDCKSLWQDITSSLSIKYVFWNKDYEPYAVRRDREVYDLLTKKGIKTSKYKDQLIFEPGEVVKNDASPYTVFTPYSRKWLQRLETQGIPDNFNSEGYLDQLAPISIDLPALGMTGFKESSLKPRSFSAENIEDYDKHRDYPWKDATTHAGPHLRFGTLSIRKIVKTAFMVNTTYLGELIWREFFMQILYHYPDVVTKSFRPRYDSIKWINDKELFEKWCRGETGYPLVDAGMRQLKASGYMHNRVRMVTASFLCKHLLTDWRWGEKYFAEKLLDYELSSNNGNWQWAAGTGCDAAPYFRVFNPYQQAKKFDNDNKYILKWIPELNTADYPAPIVDHSSARKRAIETYKYYLNRNKGK
ncbi:MAG: deoxyribodipyrimidine photo-lyase [Bacteroidales bacterium]|nr:deoxyribodipyrimidine photo-lyase [Bacteroidales bacterium]